MAQPSRPYVDTNIFIRLFESSDELSRALADLFLLEPRGEKPFLATSELTLAELLVVPCREGDNQRISLYNSWTTTNDYLEVGPVDRSVLWPAAVLRASYSRLKLPDAIHIATALRFGCSHFMTADLRLGGSYELFHQHWGLVFGPASVEIMRPEVDVIKGVVNAAQ